MMYTRPMLVLAGLILLSTLLGFSSLLRVRQTYHRDDPLTLPTVVLAYVFYALHTGLTTYAAWYSLWFFPLPRVLALPVGSALIIVGLALYILAVRRLRSLERTSGLQTDQLITSGVYGFSRNPQNLGWGFALLGVAIAGRSGLALGFTALFFVVFHTYIKTEEDYLERCFGKTYRRYKRQVPRYLPGPLAHER